MIEILPKELASIDNWKGLLKTIHYCLPDMKVTAVDYTIDQFCYDFRSAERLFQCLYRHLYIPHQRETFIYGGNLTQFGNRTRMNMVCRMGNIKFYERGPDQKKKINDGWWIMEDVDRVRFEYSASRIVLKKRGISVVGDLIEHPNFFEINKNIYKFRCFEGSKKLPTIGQGYGLPDDNDNYGIFQCQLTAQRKNVTNIAHYVKEVKAFAVLKVALQNAMKNFDTEWQGL